MTENVKQVLRRWGSGPVETAKNPSHIEGISLLTLDDLEEDCQYFVEEEGEIKLVQYDSGEPIIESNNMVNCSTLYYEVALRKCTGLGHNNYGMFNLMRTIHLIF